MYIYTAGKRKVRLKELKTERTTYQGETLMRAGVGQRSYAPILSEQVTRASMMHFSMAGDAGFGRAAAVPEESSGPPPAAFQESESGLTRVVYKEVILRFSPGLSAKKRKQILDKHGLKIRSKNPFIPDQVVAYEASGKNVGAGMLDIANDCSEMDEIVFSTPNFVSQFLRHQNLPSIPSAQWHLRNLAKKAGQTKNEDVDARGAWKITQGKKAIAVAVLDDGVEVAHPNLKSNIRKNPDSTESKDLFGRDFFVPDDSPDHFDPNPKLFRYPYNQMGGNDIHGTPCAGVIAASGKNALGIAPKCSILPVKIFHADALASDARVADAIRYAAQHADILSCSWSGPMSPDIDLAIQDAKQLGRGGKGAAVFCASGNKAPRKVSFPAAFDDSIAIGASTDTAARAGYSQFGPELWVVAPSSGGVEGIYTTDVAIANRGFNTGIAAAGGADGEHTNSFGGTSSATPLAAGIAALMLSANPKLEREQIKQILADTADKIGGGYDPQTGKSSEYGFGRVNAAAAVEAAKNFTS